MNGMDITAQIDLFFAEKPEAWVLFNALSSAVLAAYPSARQRVMKTCISFDDPKPFLYVSFPRGKGKGGLLLTISLREAAAHPRIAMLVPVSKARVTAHIPLEDETGIDDELMELIQRGRR